MRNEPQPLHARGKSIPSPSNPDQTRPRPTASVKCCGGIDPKLQDLGGDQTLRRPQMPRGVVPKLTMTDLQSGCSAREEKRIGPVHAKLAKCERSQASCGIHLQTPTRLDLTSTRKS